MVSLTVQFVKMNNHIYLIIILVAAFAIFMAFAVIKIFRKITSETSNIVIGNPVTTSTVPSKTNCNRYYFIISEGDLENSDDYTVYCEFTDCNWFPKTLNFGYAGKSLEYCVAGVFFSLFLCTY